MRIRVERGYRPPVVHARRGEPLRLVFSREETAPCSEYVVFPSFGKSVMLPPFEDVPIEIQPEAPGEYPFTCQLGMLEGRLIVEDARDGASSAGVSLPAPSPTSDAGAPPATSVAVQRSSIVSRAWGALLAAWGAFTGVLPHVLHHVGPLAGAALFAGLAGRIVFAAVGFVVAIPFLRRLERRYKTLKAPAIALAIFASAFAVSSFVVGPAISGVGGQDPPATEQGGHAEHHQSEAP